LAKNSNANDATRVSTASRADDATMVRPSVGATGMVAAAEPATLLFALSFQGSGSAEALAGTLTWSSDVPVVSMLADLIAASAASDSTDNEGVLSATMPTSLQAVILASRAQKLADAYSQYPNAALRCLSIAVFSGVAEESALRKYLKASNRSGQVLLAGTTFKQLESMPGFQMRKVPVSSGQKLELHELVLPTSDRPAPTAARTKSVTSVSQPSAFNPLAEAKTTIIQTGHTSQVTRTSETPVIVHRKDEEAAGGGSKKIVIGAIAAVLLIGAGIAVKMSGGSHSAGSPVETKPPVSAPAETGGSTPAPVAATPAPASKADAPVPAMSAKEKKAAAKAAAAPKLDLPEEPKPQVKTAEPKPEVVVSRGGSGFSADQIRSILDKADTLAGNGKYDEAIRNYNVVLQNDPGNSRAREGKARAIANKSM
jgi:hypothetical protein